MTRLASRALDALFEYTANASGRRDSIPHRFEIGRLILEERAERSLRELARASGGRFSRTYLHRCTMAYRLGRSFPFILESKSLRVSHLDAVERLARPARGRLLLEADRESWSVRKLRERALSEARRSAPTVDMLVARRALRQLMTSLSALATCQQPDTEEALDTIEEIQRGLAEARQHLSVRLHEQHLANTG